jgi:sugar lactone lactonase YvrE
MTKEQTMYKINNLILFSSICFFLTVGCNGPDNPSFGPNAPDPNPTGKDAAMVTAIDPPEGFLRDELNVSGTGFNTTPEYNLVQFGNRVGTVTSATATNLTVVAPNLAGATVKVRVSVVGSEFWSNEVDFTFKPTLRVIDNEVAWPKGVAVDDDGNVYIGSATDSAIYKITPDAVKTQFAKVAINGAIHFGPQNYLYVCQKDSGRVVRISPDTTTIEDVALVPGVVDFDWDTNGNLFLASGDDGIYVMDSGGTVTPLATSLGAVKNLRIFDNYVYISKIWDGVISRFAISGTGIGPEEIYLDVTGDELSPSSMEFDSEGTLYWTHAWDTSLFTLKQDGETETLYEGELMTPMRYMTFKGKTIYVVFPGWGDVGQTMSAYIGVEQAPRYGTN